MPRRRTAAGTACSIDGCALPTEAGAPVALCAGHLGLAHDRVACEDGVVDALPSPAGSASEVDRHRVSRSALSMLRSVRNPDRRAISIRDGLDPRAVGRRRYA